MVSCHLTSEHGQVIFTWKIDAAGYLPANGKTLRLCPMMSKGLDPGDHKDEAAGRKKQHIAAGTQEGHTDDF